MYRMCVVGFATALLLAGAARPALAQEQDKECLDLIRKAVKAQGGQEVLDKHKAVTVKTKGTVHIMGGLKYTDEVQFQFPDKFRTDIQIEAGGQTFTITQAFDGKKGWSRLGDKVMDLDEKDAAEAKALLYSGKVSNLVDLLKDKKFALSPLGETKVNDRAAAGVLVKHKGQRDVSLYFDKKSGLLTKTVETVYDKMADKEVTQEKIFADHKVIDGQQTPHKLTITRDGEPFVDAEVTDVSFVERHDASVFAKPE